MRILFATNDHYYSRIFNYLFDEPVSHVALGFTIDGIDLVVEATKPRGRLSHIKYWMSKYRVVYSVNIDLGESDEIRTCKNAIADTVMVPYDWGAYWFAFFVAVKKRLLGIPYPKENEWESSKLRHCGEVMNSIKEVLSEYGIETRDLDFSAMTPHMIGQRLYVRSLGNPYVSWPKGAPDESKVQAIR